MSDDDSKNKDDECDYNINPLKIKHYKGKYMQIYNQELYYLLDPNKYEISK